MVVGDVCEMGQDPEIELADPLIYYRGSHHTGWALESQGA